MLRRLISAASLPPDAEEVLKPYYRAALALLLVCLVPLCIQSGYPSQDALCCCPMTALLIIQALVYEYSQTLVNGYGLSLRNPIHFSIYWLLNTV